LKVPSGIFSPIFNEAAFLRPPEHARKKTGVFIRGLVGLLWFVISQVSYSFKKKKKKAHTCSIPV
jgi:hypothetical protein